MSLNIKKKLALLMAAWLFLNLLSLLKTNLAIKELLGEQFSYCESQRDIILKKSDSELDSVINNKDAIDPKNPNTWLAKDVFY